MKSTRVFLGISNLSLWTWSFREQGEFQVSVGNVQQTSCYKSLSTRELQSLHVGKVN